MKNTFGKVSVQNLPDFENKINEFLNSNNIPLYKMDCFLCKETDDILIFIFKVGFKKDNIVNSLYIKFNLQKKRNICSVHFEYFLFYEETNSRYCENIDDFIKRTSNEKNKKIASKIINLCFEEFHSNKETRLYSVLNNVCFYTSDFLYKNFYIDEKYKSKIYI